MYRARNPLHSPSIPHSLTDHVTSHLTHGMLLMVEGDINSLWIVYHDRIFGDLHCGEIAPASIITVSPAKSVTIEFAKPLLHEQESSCSYRIISVDFARPPWTYAEARRWWSKFEIKMQGEWKDHTGMTPENIIKLIAKCGDINELTAKSYSRRTDIVNFGSVNMF